MSNVFKQLSIFSAAVLLFLGAISCGSSSDGDSSDTRSDSVSTSGDATIQGTFSMSTSASRTLTIGKGAIAGVEISALGSSATTDENGNYTLTVDGSFSGGAVEFTLVGSGVNASVVLEEIQGGAGAVTNVNFVLEDSGDVTGTVYDATGVELYATPTTGKLSCDSTGTFYDGSGGALWKPYSEGTGTVVILMPPEYQYASVEVFNSAGELVATPLMRHCCEHNGGRDHTYLTASAGSLSASGTPITVKFTFSDGTTDCRVVNDPTARND